MTLAVLLNKYIGTFDVLLILNFIICIHLTEQFDDSLTKKTMFTNKLIKCSCIKNNKKKTIVIIYTGYCIM